jgi:ring-1,2-phenylacetyl-CoA epoxidase subunit PaaE
MDEREGLSDEELEAGYALACQAHPLSDNVVIEFA